MKTANILKDLNYNNEKVAISVLFETATTKEIRILFKKGQVMKKHQTSFPITVTMLKGELDFGVNDSIHNLVKGDIVALDASIPHDLTAKKKSIVRLTLSKSDSVTRVENVVK